MFTGLVSAVGVVRAVRPAGGGIELDLDAPYPDLVPGESVAVDGACFTVERHGPGWFGVHVVRTSLDRTAFGDYAPGRRVNLERALRMGDRLGGHLVQGHVDAIGTVERVADREDVRLIDLRVPDDVAAVSPALGSITVDGVSLTVNARPAPSAVQVSLIPFTLQHTTLGDRRPGDRVHLEADAVGKWVRHLLGHE
ncbi:MAG: riboflavin synthase [Gemmatimonadales bacterium]